MNRTDFLKNKSVAEFTTWLANHCDTVIINLDIKKSRFVPEEMKIEVVGLNAVLKQYVWRSEGMSNGQWPETKKYLGKLATALKLALSAKNDDDAVMSVCRQILQWGGDRNPEVGASPFLKELHKNKKLSEYLNNTKKAFGLDDADTEAAHPPAIRMNSMLTKIHALASDDGLPIYDSRVAAAIAALVELWRQENELQNQALPIELVFPATLTSRTVQHLFGNATAPGVMSYAPAKTDQTARQWSGAKIRLAWVMGEVLSKAGKLFAIENSANASDRMHAFEATLFIIGYNVKCLAANSTTAEIDEKKQRELKTAARKSLEQEQCDLPRKSISTLAGTDNNLHYAGDIETGISGVWGKTHFAFERDFLQELLGNFQSRQNVELGASVDGIVRDGTVGRWIDDNYPAISRKYASAIAAILVHEELATCMRHPRPIKLNFL